MEKRSSFIYRPFGLCMKVFSETQKGPFQKWLSSGNAKFRVCFGEELFRNRYIDAYMHLYTYIHIHLYAYIWKGLFQNTIYKLRIDISNLFVGIALFTFLEKSCYCWLIYIYSNLSGRPPPQTNHFGPKWLPIYIF